MSSDTDRIDISSKKKIERILIVRLSAMGDVIHTLPAVHALRAAFPQAHIGWLIEERWAELLCAAGSPRRATRSALRPLVDEVHAVNLKGWRRSLFSASTLQQAAKVWNDVRGAAYDVAVDLQGAMRSAVLAHWSGASVVYGAAEARESPASLWYTRKVADLGVRSILNYGPGEEELVRAAEAASDGAAQAMSCSISELIALTRRAQLFIGGDTGPLHLAAALRVPVVGIYGPTDPARNGPYGTRSVVLRNAESVTSHARRAEAEEGMLGIGSEAVIAAARELMGGDLRG